MTNNMHYHAELGNESKAINKILRGWVMENKWKTTSLAELGVELIDCDHKTPKAVENGVPYIGIPQMDKGAINFEAKPRLISEEDYVTWTRKANPKFGDVILSRRCNSGETVYVPQGVKFALGQNLVLLRPTGERLHPEYLRWAVQGTEWWNEVAKYLNPGSIFESLKCREIPKFQIPEPPKSQQVKICDMLSSISDKIELNKEANQTLEQMAQTLFKSWFVDFDPVFDNLLAKIDFDLSKLPTDFPEFLQKRVEKRLHALNSTETGRATLAKLQNSSVFANNTNANKDASSVLDNNIHQHFPSEFEYNDKLGWIPKGWEDATFAKVANALSGYAFKGKDFSENGCAVIKIKNISADRSVGIYDVNRVPQNLADSADRFLLSDGEIVMAMTGATVGKFGVIASENSEPYYLNQRVCKLIPKIKNGTPFLFSALNKAGVEESIVNAAQGSAQPNISATGILAIKLLVPASNLIELFNSLLMVSFKRKIALRKENYTLTKLRDTLLPKLISGEITIKKDAV